ncbi:MAG TPA: prevent-host-death protein [Campylobacterales bacterium]|nr:prevent-host-death protein [Campylobacterales bacterium]
MVIPANDLKTKGVSIIESMLEKLDEVLISIRGKNRFVVVDMNRYNYLRECELEKALRDVQDDIANGRSRVLSSEEHFKELDNALRD